ncbi:MAG TPA: hypothetical protein VLV78_15180 [Thermoanaerobaculia bacterium]|nr:hypothetical protein [Thermoanaerobaculia bacterium]
MSDDDRDLGDAFARLRQAESRSVPPFAVTPARHSVPRLAFALIALMMLVAGVFVARRAQDRQPVPTAPVSVTLSTWRAPTDFLLKTPGRELLDSTPRLQPQTPVINIAGGRS